LTEANTIYFNLLKEAVAKTFLESHSAPKKIAEWKGETIVLFQEDLSSNTKGSISEKSFYNYFKNSPEKLPRIDVLNLLSLYAGYTNWEEFKITHSDFIIDQKSEKKKTSMSNLLLGALLFLGVVLAVVFYNQSNTFTFCLVDEDQKTALQGAANIEILIPNESSVFQQSDSEGCFSHNTSRAEIRFVVQSPYYKTDTIVRSISENKNTRVPMRTDDYALMLKYYSDGNLADVEKRRTQLENLIDETAQIYQVFPNVTGIELYSKKQFVNKMTIPTSALKNLHILDKEYANGKITKLKFIIQ